MLLSKGVKTWDNAFVNGFEELRLIKEIKALIPTKGAKIYLEIQKKGLVPGWVEEEVDLKQMKRAAIEW